MGTTTRSSGGGLDAASSILESPWSLVLASFPVSLRTYLGRRARTVSGRACGIAAAGVAGGRRASADGRGAGTSSRVESDGADGTGVSSLGSCEWLSATMASMEAHGTSTANGHRHLAEAASEPAGRGPLASRCAPAIACHRIVSSSAESGAEWSLDAASLRRHPPRGVSRLKPRCARRFGQGPPLPWPRRAWPRPLRRRPAWPRSRDAPG